MLDQEESIPQPLRQGLTRILARLKKMGIDVSQADFYNEHHEGGITEVGWRIKRHGAFLSWGIESRLGKESLFVKVEDEDGWIGEVDCRLEADVEEWHLALTSKALPLAFRWALGRCCPPGCKRQTQRTDVARVWLELFVLAYKGYKPTF